MALLNEKNTTKKSANFYTSKIALAAILFAASSCQSTTDTIYTQPVVNGSLSDELRLKVDTELRSILGGQEEIKIGSTATKTSKIGGTLVCGYVSSDTLNQYGFGPMPFEMRFDTAGNYGMGRVAQSAPTRLSILLFCADNGLKPAPL